MFKDSADYVTITGIIDTIKEYMGYLAVMCGCEKTLEDDREAEND